MRDDAVLRRALPLGRGLGPAICRDLFICLFVYSLNGMLSRTSLSVADVAEDTWRSVLKIAFRSKICINSKVTVLQKAYVWTGTLFHAQLR